MAKPTWFKRRQKQASTTRIKSQEESFLLTLIYSIFLAISWAVQYLFNGPSEPNNIYRHQLRRRDRSSILEQSNDLLGDARVVLRQIDGCIAIIQDVISPSAPQPPRSISIATSEQQFGSSTRLPKLIMDSKGQTSFKSAISRFGSRLKPQKGKSIK